METNVSSHSVTSTVIHIRLTGWVFHRVSMTSPIAFHLNYAFHHQPTIPVPFRIILGDVFTTAWKIPKVMIRDSCIESNKAIVWKLNIWRISHKKRCLYFRKRYYPLHPKLTSATKRKLKWNHVILSILGMRDDVFHPFYSLGTTPLKNYLLRESTSAPIVVKLWPYVPQ